MTIVWILPSYLIFLFFGLYTWALGGAVFPRMRGMDGVSAALARLRVADRFFADCAFAISDRSLVLSRISYRHLNNRRSRPPFKGTSSGESLAESSQALAPIAAIGGGVNLDLCSGL
jgi:hypothetical protein